MQTNPNPSVQVPTDPITAKLVESFKSPAPKRQLPTTNSVSGAPYIFEGHQAEEFRPYFPAERTHYIPGTTEHERAVNQGTAEQTGHAIMQFGRNVLPATASYLTSMVDIGDLGVMGTTPFNGTWIDKAAGGNKDEIGNAVADWYEEFSQRSRKEYPIYRENPDKAFDFGDNAWWISGIESVAESVPAFYLASLTGAKVLNSVPFLTNLGMKGELLKGITLSTLATNAESIQIGTQVKQQTKQDALARGYSEQEADKISNMAAQTAVQINSFNAVFNTISALWILKNPLAAMGSRGARNTGILETLANFSETPSIKNTLKAIAIEGVSEFTEEGVVNQAAQLEGEKKGKALIEGEDYNTTLTSLADDIFTKESLEQGFWGILAGSGQAALERGLGYNLKVLGKDAPVIENGKIKRDADGNIVTTKQSINQITKNNLTLKEELKKSLNIPGIKAAITNAVFQTQQWNKLNAIDRILQGEDPEQVINEAISKAEGLTQEEKTAQIQELISLYDPKTQKGQSFQELKATRSGIENTLLAHRAYEAFTSGNAEIFEQELRDIKSLTPEQAAQAKLDPKTYHQQTDKALEQLARYETVYNKYAGKYNPIVTKELYNSEVKLDNLNSKIINLNSEVQNIISQYTSEAGILNEQLKDTPEEFKTSSVGIEDRIKEIKQKYQPLIDKVKQVINPLEKEKKELEKYIAELQVSEKVPETLIKKILGEKIQEQKELAEKEYINSIIKQINEHLNNGAELTFKNKKGTIITEGDKHYFVTSNKPIQKTEINLKNIEELINGLEGKELIEFKKAKEQAQKQHEARIQAFEQVLGKNWEELVRLDDKLKEVNKLIDETHRKALATAKKLKHQRSSKVSQQLIEETELLLEQYREDLNTYQQYRDQLEARTKTIEDNIQFIEDFLKQTKDQNFFSEDFKAPIATSVDILKNATESTNQLKDAISKSKILIENLGEKIKLLKEYIQQLEETLTKHKAFAEFINDFINHSEEFVKSTNLQGGLKYDIGTLMKYLAWRKDYAQDTWYPETLAKHIYDTIRELNEAKVLKQEIDATIKTLESEEFEGQDKRSSVPMNKYHLEILESQLTQQQKHLQELEDKLKLQEKAEQVFNLYNQALPIFEEIIKRKPKRNLDKEESEQQSPEEEITVKPEERQQRPRKEHMVSTAGQAYETEKTETGRHTKTDETGQPIVKVRGSYEHRFDLWLDKLGHTVPSNYSVKFYPTNHPDNPISLVSKAIENIWVETVKTLKKNSDGLLDLSNSNIKSIEDIINKTKEQTNLDIKTSPKEVLDEINSRLKILNTLKIVDSNQEENIMRGIEIQVFKDNKPLKLDENGVEDENGTLAHVWLMSPTAVLKFNNQGKIDSDIAIPNNSKLTEEQRLDYLKSLVQDLLNQRNAILSQTEPIDGTIEGISAGIPVTTKPRKLTPEESKNAKIFVATGKKHTSGETTTPGQIYLDLDNKIEKLFPVEHKNIENSQQRVSSLIDLITYALHQKLAKPNLSFAEIQIKDTEGNSHSLINFKGAGLITDLLFWGPQTSYTNQIYIQGREVKFGNDSIDITELEDKSSAKYKELSDFIAQKYMNVVRYRLSSDKSDFIPDFIVHKDNKTTTIQILKQTNYSDWLKSVISTTRAKSEGQQVSSLSRYLKLSPIKTQVKKETKKETKKKTKTVKTSDIEAKKADIERRRQEVERLSNKELTSSTGKINTGKIEIPILPSQNIDKTIYKDNKGVEYKVKANFKNLQDVLLGRNGKYLFRGMQGRFFVLAKVGDFYLPFYISSAGTSGKKQGEWYPFFGYTGNWLVKGRVGNKGEMEYSQKISEVQKLLQENLQFPSRFLNLKGEMKVGDNVIYDINQDFNYIEHFTTFGDGTVKREGDKYPILKETLWIQEITGFDPRNVNNDGKGSADAWINDIIALIENAPLASKGKINAKYDAELAALEETPTKKEKKTKKTKETKIEETTPETLSRGSNFTAVQTGENTWEVKTGDKVFTILEVKSKNPKKFVSDKLTQWEQQIDNENIDVKKLTMTEEGMKTLRTVCNL